MPVPTISRRAAILRLGVMALAAVPPLRPAPGAAGTGSRTSPYRVDISMLFGLIRYTVTGTVTEEIDAGDGGYRVVMSGAGSGVSSRVEARGLIAGGRYRPLEVQSAHSMAGRPSRLSIRYDYARRVIDYHAVGHTLLLGRRRQVEDTVRIPTEPPVDDAVSTLLNFAAGQLERDATGLYRTQVVRRTRATSEGPDDVAAGGYRVEIVPFGFRVHPEPGTGKLIALLDMSGWSSWARGDEPTRIVFSPDRRIESVESRLILGSSMRLQLS